MSKSNAYYIGPVEIDYYRIGGDPIRLSLQTRELAGLIEYLSHVREELIGQLEGSA